MSEHGFYIRWLRTNRVDQTLRFVEGICLHRKSREIREEEKIEKDLILNRRAQHVLSYPLI